MKAKQAFSIPVICAALLLSGQAFADSVIHTLPDGETKIYPSHGTDKKSAQQVQRELDELKRNPVSADGQYRYAGVEQGWVLIPHEYAYRNGKWQHVDKLPHDTPAPSLEMTPEEKKQREALYQGG